MNNHGVRPASKNRLLNQLIHANLESLIEALPLPSESSLVSITSSAIFKLKLPILASAAIRDEILFLEWKDKLMIDRDDGNDIGSLARLSHKFAYHIVSQGLHSSLKPSRENAEAFAYLVEEWIGLKFIIKFHPNFVQSWIQYHKRIDAFNLAIFGIQSGFNNPWSNQLSGFIQKSPHYHARTYAALVRRGVISIPCFGASENDLNLLGINDHQLKPYKIETIAEALLQLRKTSLEAYEIFFRNTKWINFVSPLESTQKNIFASATFGEVQGITYLSPISDRYAPPNRLLIKPSIDFLAENIFHESIHQFLFPLFEKNLILLKKYRGEFGPKIFIPWRDAKWNLEHAIHAMVVYTHILNLGRTHSPLKEPQSIQKIVTFLRTMILSQSECFASSGLKMIGL